MQILYYANTHIQTLTHMLKATQTKNKQTTTTTKREKKQHVRLKWYMIYACSPLRQSRLWRVIHKFFMIGVLDAYTNAHTNPIYSINQFIWLFGFAEKNKWKRKVTEIVKNRLNKIYIYKYRHKYSWKMLADKGFFVSKICV